MLFSPDSKMREDHEAPGPGYDLDQSSGNEKKHCVEKLTLQCIECCRDQSFEPGTI